MEGAPGRSGGERRRSARNGRQVPEIAVKTGQAGEQPDGVGMSRTPEDLLHRPRLHDPARVHDRHPVCDLGYDAQIMGDEDHRGSGRAAPGGQHLQHLGLDCHVKGGGGLVGHEHGRPVGDGDGDHHPLAHTPRHLVGELAEALPRVGDAHQFEQLHGPVARSGAGRAVYTQGLGDLAPHPHDRIQRGHGVLEYHGDFLAPDGLQFRGGEVQQVPPPVDHLSGRDTSIVRQQSDQGRDRDRLPGAGLAHHAQYVTGIQGETDILDRRQDAPLRFEANRETSHL